MPSAPRELHEKWQNKGPYYGFGDANALHLLEQGGIKPSRFGTFYIPKGRAMTEEENSALDYLFMEWDYGIEPV